MIDAAIVVNTAEGASATVTSNGCLLEGEDDIYYVTDTDREAVLDRVVVPSDEFTFNGETFDGFSGLDQTFTGTNGVTYTAGDIAMTETLESDGAISVVIDGIVANAMSAEQKVAFDSSYDENDTQIRFYIAVQIAVNPGETVTLTTSSEKTETVENGTNEVEYITWVIEVGNDGYDPSNPPTLDYAVVSLNDYFITVTSGETTYTITFGDIYLPQSAWCTTACCGD